MNPSEKVSLNELRLLKILIKAKIIKKKTQALEGVLTYSSYNGLEIITKRTKKLRYKADKLPRKSFIPTDITPYIEELHTDINNTLRDIYQQCTNITSLAETKIKKENEK